MIQDDGVTEQQSSMGRHDTEHTTPVGIHDSVTTLEDDSNTYHENTSEERTETSSPVPAVTEVMQHWTASHKHTHTNTHTDTHNTTIYMYYYIPYPSNQGYDDEGDHQSSPADQDIPSGDHDRSSSLQDRPLDDQDTPTIPQDTTDEDRIQTLPQITEVPHG